MMGANVSRIPSIQKESVSIHAPVMGAKTLTGFCNVVSMFQSTHP